MVSEHTVTAIGQDGLVRQFRYRCKVVDKLYDVMDPTSTRRHWELEVLGEHEPAATFRSTAVEIDRNSAVSIEIFADSDEYRQLGLPEALMRELALRSGRQISSSSNREAAHLLRGEYRTPDADKVWRRLNRSGEATYHANVDRYVLLPIEAAPDKEVLDSGADAA